MFAKRAGQQHISRRIPTQPLCKLRLTMLTTLHVACFDSFVRSISPPDSYVLPTSGHTKFHFQINPNEMTHTAWHQLAGINRHVYETLNESINCDLRLQNILNRTPANSRDLVCDWDATHSVCRSSFAVSWSSYQQLWTRVHESHE